jgi:hypothetical protein
MTWTGAFSGEGDTYKLTLTCDGPGGGLVCGAAPNMARKHTHIGVSYTDAARQAREAGWTLRISTCVCPVCVTVPAHVLARARCSRESETMAVWALWPLGV